MALIRLLGEPDLSLLLEHLTRHAAESGSGGAPIFGPQDPSAELDVDRLRARRRVGWLRQPTELAWERSWGLFRDDEVVGHVELHGGKMPSELHRCTLGMGLEAPLRGHGYGARLLKEAIGWARSCVSLAWIDLGVFSRNHAARALYDKHGFREVGRVSDRFRVSGTTIDDVQMVLAVR